MTIFAVKSRLDHPARPIWKAMKIEADVFFGEELGL